MRALEQAAHAQRTAGPPGGARARLRAGDGALTALQAVDRTGGAATPAPTPAATGAARGKAPVERRTLGTQFKSQLQQLMDALHRTKSAPRARAHALPRPAPPLPSLACWRAFRSGSPDPSARSPHFIRCIKPNAQKVGDHFDAQMVARQLRCVLAARAAVLHLPPQRLGS